MSVCGQCYPSSYRHHLRFSLALLSLALPGPSAVSLRLDGWDSWQLAAVSPNVLESSLGLTIIMQMWSLTPTWDCLSQSDHGQLNSTSCISGCKIRALAGCCLLQLCMRLPLDFQLSPSRPASLPARSSSSGWLTAPVTL